MCQSNKGMELTASSVRCAPASGSSSCLAFGDWKELSHLLWRTGARNVRRSRC